MLHLMLFIQHETFCCKVQQEMARMEAEGIVFKVDVPTPWCAGIVAVYTLRNLAQFASVLI